MKRILIIGKNSYIGVSFKKWLKKFPNDYYVEELDVQNDSWKEFPFNSFDVIFHVAGIAHMKEVKENEDLYFSVNRDLVYSIAKKAKTEGIKQFIFMSSMSVYGLEYSKYPISMKTQTNPNSYYGKSKLEAEKLLEELKTDSFKVCILRPPMVYGTNSPGNLTKLFNMVQKVHMFPTFINERSSISVDNLSLYIKKYIDRNESGLYFPQNDEYMCTYYKVREEMENRNVQVIYIPIFNFIIKFFIGKTGLITKVFGNLVYDKAMNK